MICHVICQVTVTQVLYTGKSTALGIKQGGPAAGRWAELPITKSPTVMQVTVGHDGQHVVLLSEYGGIFFGGSLLSRHCMNEWASEWVSGCVGWWVGGLVGWWVGGWVLERMGE